jgi:hypothetical protein
MSKHDLIEEADAPGLISPLNAAAGNVRFAAGHTIIQDQAEFEGPTDPFRFFTMDPDFDGKHFKPDVKARTKGGND